MKIFIAPSANLILATTWDQPQYTFEMVVENIEKRKKLGGAIESFSLSP